MRHDEELCREAVSRLLQQRGIEDLWKEGTEPPDWFLEVAGQLFAVEVTSIHGSTNLGGREHTWVQLSNELAPFSKDICREVEARVQIPGWFTVNFPAIPHIKNHRSAIVEALVDYFEDSDSAPHFCGWHTVLRLERREVAVYRISEKGSTLDQRLLLTGAAISRLDDQLSEILPRIVSKKALKMRNITSPSILVILDEYRFQRSVEEWRARLPPEVSCFMAVVRVQQGNAEVVSGALPIG
jgi:hypothetical protein